MKVTAAITAMNAGEMSPRMDARIDFDKYASALSRSLNLLPIPQGGVVTRPGTRYINGIKTAADSTHIYPFEPVSGSAYVLEFGDFYTRFYRYQARLAASTVSSAVTNGSFTTDIANWDDLSTGSGAISHATNRMLLDGATDGYAWAEQDITISGGDQSTEHVFRFTLAGDPGSKVTVQIGTASGGHQLFQGVGMGMGEHMVAVTPGTSPIYFQVINKQSDDVYLDEVSILSNTPLELTSPYAKADVGELRFAQSNDVLYIFHEDYQPRKLERRGNSSWSLVKVFFTDGPWLETNPETDLEEANLVLNPALDGGLSSWSDSVSGDGLVDYDPDQSVVFLKAVNNSDGAELRQTITTGAPNESHVIHYQIAGGGRVSVKVGTSAGASDIYSATRRAGWFSDEFTPGASPFYLTFARPASQPKEHTPGVGGAFCYNVTANLLQASATTGSVTVTALNDYAPFASTDVGRAIRLEHAGRQPGWGIITAYTNSQTVTVKVYHRFASVDPTESWRLGAWSDTTGWPKIGTFYQQRLFAARTEAQPQTVWASQSGDFENFAPDSWVEGALTVEDDDALNYTLASKRGAPIQWIIGSRRMIVGTATGQWALSSRGAALTPSDFGADAYTSVRGAEIEPIEIDNVGVFVERDVQSLNDIGYSYEIDGYQAADLNVLADHMAGPGFAQIVYQAKPYSVIWARKSDGTLACLTYKRSQSVTAWSPVKIAGSSAGDAVVESMAVIPGAEKSGSQVYDSDDRDEVWMVVKRTINGSTTRYIEVMEGFFKGPNRAEYDAQSDWRTAMLTAQKDAVHVDSAVTYSGSSTTAMTGLTHLVGESVMVNGAGLVQGPFTVNGSGQITLTTAVTKAQIGLSYGWRWRGLKLPYGAQQGSALGQKKAIGDLAFILLDACSFSYGIDFPGELGGDPEFKTASAHIASNGALYTGEVVYPVVGGGNDTDARITLKGSNPLPWGLLGLAAQQVTRELPEAAR